MNVYKLTAAKKLECFEEALPEAPEGKMKVRVTKVLLCEQDVAVFLGKTDTKYPIIPGMFAVGILAEDYGDSYPKGTRVLLHTFLPAEDTGTEKRDFSEDDFEVCGNTRDGYLQDIVFVTESEITLLPDSVSEEEALILHHVAFANAIVESLAVEKGQHVAVVGASPFGVFVCQLLIYRQAAPILIDSDQSRLDFARTCGVYYTVLSDEELQGNVGTLTGGRLADGAVYVTDAALDNPAVAFSVCARESNLVIGGFNSCEHLFDLNEATRKHITVHCLSGNSENLESAINLMANKAVNVEQFEVVSLNPADPEFFAEYAEKERKINDFTYVKML